MKPFKLTFFLETPPSVTYPYVHLDSILAHLWLRKELGEAFWLLPAKKVIEFNYEDLPLKYSCKYEVFHGSAADFHVPFSHAKSITIYKRFCDKHFDFNRAKVKQIDTRRGHFKNYSIKVTYLPTDRVTFYGCGDIEGVEELIRNLTGVGKHVTIGFGFIRDYRIEETPKDYSLFKDGRVMRAIPAKHVKSDRMTVLAYKPPYWSRKNHVLCAVPGSKVLGV